MGIVATMVNYDEEFARLTFDPLIANKFDISIPEQKELLDKHLITHYDHTDTIEFGATCHCQKHTRVDEIGIVCSVCKTPVESTTTQAIKSVLWLQAPEGVPALMHPEMYLILEPKLKTGHVDFLEYLINTKYRFDMEKPMGKETRKRLDRFLAYNPRRGFKAFVEDFDKHIEFFASEKMFGNNVKERHEFMTWIDTYRHLFFPKYLMVPNRVCFVMESTNSGRYVDNPLNAAKDAVLTMASASSSVIPLRQTDVENRVSSSIKSLCQYYHSFMKDRMASKSGVLRKHVFGSRLHYTARAVITSITDPHDYDELHLPWGLGIQLFKYHLVNKLLKRGMTSTQAMDFVYRSVSSFNPMMEALLKELVDEAPGKGISCIFSRNPTLQRGSTQQFFITKFKSNVADNTIGLSALVLKAPNRQES